MTLIKLTALVALLLASLLTASGQAFAGVNFVAPGVAGSVTNLTVGGNVYNVNFVGTVTHTNWANQLDFTTEADAQTAVSAVAAALNAAGGVASLRYTTNGGTFDHTGGVVWYAADLTSLYGETILKNGSNWQLANPFPGGATAPLNNSFPLALDFSLVAPPAWTNLGGGLAGVGGVPQLAGTGTLVGGQPASINLTTARPSAPAALFVSLSSVPSPFKGGTLVTVPVLLTVASTTSPAGTLALPFTWPAGLPSGFNIYYQYGIQDPAAVQGVALSNALKSTTP